MTVHDSESGLDGKGELREEVKQELREEFQEEILSEIHEELREELREELLSEIYREFNEKVDKLEKDYVPILAVKRVLLEYGFSRENVDEIMGTVQEVNSKLGGVEDV